MLLNLDIELKTKNCSEQKKNRISCAHVYLSEKCRFVILPRAGASHISKVVFFFYRLSTVFTFAILYQFEDY